VWPHAGGTSLWVLPFDVICQMYGLMKTLAYRIALLLLSAIGVQGTYAQQVIKDCTDCPEMVVIPAGSFMMGGDPFSNSTQANELPRHRVQLRSFAVGKYEVTQEQWYTIMGNNPSEKKGRALPVTQVSWNDIQQFITKLNERIGQKYRLPSEAEWEYAARAGTTTEWSFGNDESKADGYAWSGEQSGYRPREVGQKIPNSFGLFDMHGNVWEWTQDCFHETYAGAPTDGSAWTTGCAGNYRMLRGGSFFYYSALSRSAIRVKVSQEIRGFDYGFRLARTL